MKTISFIELEEWLKRLKKNVDNYATTDDIKLTFTEDAITARVYNEVFILKTRDSDEE